MAHAACQWAISRGWSLIVRDRSTSGIARRTLRWNKGKQDQGLVSFDSRIGRHWSKSALDRPTSNNLSVEATDTDLSKASGACLRLKGPWGGNQTFQSFNLGRWQTRVSTVTSSRFFGGSPPRLKSWNSSLDVCGVPVGDKSGLVADWWR